MKTAIVTGGSSGIGLEAARALRDMGCRVYEISRRDHTEDGVTHIKGDVTSEADMQAAVRQVIGAEGKLDILVCCAGFGISGAVEFTELEAAKKQVNVNFFGVVNAVKAALPYMRRQGSGRIVAVSSVAMEILSRTVGAVTDDRLLAAVAGGALQAIGIGMVFRAGATTGGTDIIVRVLRLKFRDLKTGTLFMFIDGVIITVSGIVFKDLNVALYAALALTVYMAVFNAVLYGGDGARLVYIISPAKEKIAERILSELDAGATVLEGKGAYTGQKKEVLMVVLRMRSLPEARDIVREEDAKAFMIVSRATSVFGEGFKSHDEEDL